MAHLVKQQFSYFLDAEGNRVPKGTRGARKVVEKSSKWYGCGIPGMPPKKRVPLAADKEAAKRMLNDLVRRAEQGHARLPDREAIRTPLSEHLTEFQSDLTIGLAAKGGRRRRPPSEEQVKLVVQRVRDLLEGCKFAYPTDLSADAPAKLARYLHGRLGKPRKDDGLSAQSAAFYLAAARRFARWMSTKAAVRSDLFDSLPGFDPQNDRRHPRREISPEELARLIDTTRASKKVIRELTGEDRAALYLTAFATGYRAGELAELCPENFDLEADIPAVVLPAKFTKNKKAARQPIPLGLAAQLREYLVGKPQEKPVWPGTWRDRPVSVLTRDLATAKVPYCLATLNGPMYADFHSLRHSYLSALAAAGVGVKELQTLARHSDPRITLGIYTHAREESLGTSVNLLQLPGTPTAENPLAKMTRAELEAAVVALAAVVRIMASARAEFLTPLLTPTVGIAGDSSGRSETDSTFGATG